MDTGVWRSRKASEVTIAWPPWRATCARGIERAGRHPPVDDDAVPPLGGHGGARATRCSRAGANIPPLGPTAGSSGSVSVAIPATTRPGTYVLPACADDVKVIAEGDETNTCRASGAPIAVSL